MKIVHWIILGLAIIMATWFIYQTREAQPRIDTTIDLNWKFILGDPGGASDPGYNDSDWRFLSLPHDWMIEQQVSQNNPSGTAGGFYPGGIGWYRKTIDLSEYDNKEQFYLLFEGVMRNADVWFNGTHLGKQAYGYSSFYHDISELVRMDTFNVIAVRTDCSNLPVDRWYSGGGIYRHVRLIASNSLHMQIWGEAVSSRIDSDGNARLDIALEFKNNSRKNRRFEVWYDIVGPDGNLVADGKSSEYLDRGGSGRASSSFTIEDPMLWSPDTPDLYTVHCFLMDRNKKLDQVNIMHGIRTAEFDPDKGFLLNGEKLVLKGVCLHHDGGELGAAVPLESWKRRFKALKELGVNALRLAHNPHAPEVLDLCDRMGFLVIDEMYDKWEQPWNGSAEDLNLEESWTTDLSNFIRRDRNHASVILWSLGNETLEQLYIPGDGIAWYTRMKELVHSIDSSRMVTAALHPGDNDGFYEVPSSLMHVSPVVSYNYRSDSFLTWHAQYPDLVFIASETRAYGSRAKEDYQVIDFADNSWKDMAPFVAGQFIWAGIDYLGESGGWPNRGWKTGLLETNGFIKPHAWYIASRYREDPLVKLTVKDSLFADSLNHLNNWQTKWEGAPLVDHWSFMHDTREKEVVVFTNCRQVDIELNNRLIHTLNRNTFPDGVIKARVPYESGELVAHAYYQDENGEQMQVSDTLNSSFEPYALAMSPDRHQVGGNNRIVHITTSVVDSTGELNPHSRHMVNYQLDGPGRIRVIDNGDLTDHNPYGSGSREMRKGKQLLVLQAGSEPGDLVVSASAEGLRSSKVKIKSKN
ncbi:MAG: glycoside hydrolase family 2 TIM barrel-domain containing protein [Bacteroidota bacterium]|nr:glycoside hydrolase family 2 TIM barrel-domain containing protein [Bacteroidota bacterium]